MALLPPTPPIREKEGGLKSVPGKGAEEVTLGTSHETTGSVKVKPETLYLEMYC